MNLIGHTLAGRYQVVRPIGAGGMGVVYEAIQLGLGKRVAIKLIGGAAGDRTEALTRFRREADAAAALGHPNIVQVIDFVDVGDGHPFIVMEHLDGESLRQIVVREGRLDPARVCFIAGQVLSALAAAHRAGIVHRDIKPGNVVVISTTAIRDFVKIVDFGIAKLQKPGAIPSAFGTAIGTPSYMAPEQASGLEVDARADVYGVGATMLHALSGHPPPRAPVPPVSHLAPWIPSGLAEILDRALSVNPLARFASAEAMREALSPWVRRENEAPPLTAPPTISGRPIASSIGGGASTLPSSLHYAATSSSIGHVSGLPSALSTLSSQRPPHHWPHDAPPRAPGTLPSAGVPAKASSFSAWIVVGLVLGGLVLLSLAGAGVWALRHVEPASGLDAGGVVGASPGATIGADGEAPPLGAGSAAIGAKTSPLDTATSARGGSRPAPRPRNADAGPALPVSDAGSPSASPDAGSPPPGARSYAVLNVYSKNYDGHWVRTRVGQTKLSSCVNQPYVESWDTNGSYRLAYDPEGKVYGVAYGRSRYPSPNQAGNPELLSCAKKALIGLDLGPGKVPGSGVVTFDATIR